MPNDAKLGLVLGIGAFIAVAVLFYHKDLVPDRSERAPPGLTRPGAGRPRASPTSRAGRPGAQTASLRRHTVRDGDSLFALAEKFYGDGDRFIDLYLANKDVLQRPDRLPAGTVLTVPDLGDEAPEPRVAATEPARPKAVLPALPAPGEAGEPSPAEPAVKSDAASEDPKDLPAAAPAAETKGVPVPAPKEEAFERVTERSGDPPAEEKADAAVLPPLPPVPGMTGSHP